MLQDGLHGIVKACNLSEAMMLNLRHHLIFKLILSIAAAMFLAPINALALPALTLNELTQIAIQNNNDLKAAKYNIKLAKARLLQAGLWSNPSLNLSNIDDKWLTNEGEYTRTASFSQALPISGRIGKQKNVARVDVAIAMAEVCNAKRLLKGTIADNYYAILITDLRLKQLNKLLAINKQLVRVTKNRFQAAEVSELDTNSASLEYQRILQEKQMLENLRINQTALINQLLGRNPKTPLPLAKILPQINPLQYNFRELQELALRQRPDLFMLWLSLNRAQANQQLVRSERFADWTLNLGFQESKIFVEGGLPQKPDRAIALNLAIPLPLLNANQGKIMEEGIKGTQALAKMQALKLSIQTELASNYAQLLTFEKTLRQSQKATLTLRSKNLKLAANAYKNGQISLLELLQIQRQQNDLQVSYLNMLEKYLQTLVKLCTTMAGSNKTALCPFMGEKKELRCKRPVN